MSCSSPFVYQVASSIVTDEYEVGCSGSYTLSSYSVKWGGGSWCLGCSDCKWGGWQNLELKCKWNKCCWEINYPTWNIELWPNITFEASTTIPFEFESEEGVQITVSAPEGEPYQCQSIVLNACDLQFKIDDDEYELNIIPEPITVEEENGQFSINIPLESFSSKTNEWGLEYELSIDTSLQFCLNPTPPQGWINLLLDCTLSVNDEIESLEFGTKTSFSISCPIVSADEVAE